MGYHQLLVCHEGNFVVPLKVPPWWPTWQGSHAVPCYVHPVTENLRSTSVKVKGQYHHCRVASWLHLVVLRIYSAVWVVPKSNLAVQFVLFSGCLWQKRAVETVFVWLNWYDEWDDGPGILTFGTARLPSLALWKTVNFTTRNKRGIFSLTIIVIQSVHMPCSSFSTILKC